MTFHTASPGSRVFKTRLIELTALATHDIAVQLCDLNLDVGRHTGDGMAAWVPDKDNELYWSRYDGPWPTLFRHAWYVAYDQYPSGIADGVGFWAEARIFWWRRPLRPSSVRRSRSALHLVSSRPRRRNLSHVPAARRSAAPSSRVPHF